MNNWQLPSDPKIAGQVIKTHADQAAREMERGYMGKLFGMAKEKPLNGAIFAFIVSAIMLLVVYFAPGDPNQKSTVTGIVGSVFTGSLGYLFGGSSKG